ncbi:MAG: BrnA antitoxin family protein [Burkholderiales bacterium]|jgi:uncharacterized protein (DUF4415 family)|nr:BrnA antitoxin family protein [Burkholderiales bacterium]
MKHTNISKKRFDPATIKAAIDAAPDVAVLDDDCPPLKPSDFDGAIVSDSLQNLREQIAQRRTRGPGKKPARVAIQLRLPPDVLERWKASGPGWQTRMADRLSVP